MNLDRPFDTPPQIYYITALFATGLAIGFTAEGFGFRFSADVFVPLVIEVDRRPIVSVLAGDKFYFLLGWLQLC